MSLHKLSVPLWLFSEWMRELEVYRQETSIHSHLWNSWENLWLDVEARMVDLAKQDADTYVESLTDEVFVIDGLEASEWRVLLKIATNVHKRLRREATFFENSNEQDNKAFEVDDSAIVMARLRRIVSDHAKDYLSFG